MDNSFFSSLLWYTNKYKKRGKKWLYIYIYINWETFKLLMRFSKPNTREKLLLFEDQDDDEWWIKNYIILLSYLIR